MRSRSRAEKRRPLHTRLSSAATIPMLRGRRRWCWRKWLRPSLAVPRLCVPGQEAADIWWRLTAQDCALGKVIRQPGPHIDSVAFPGVEDGGQIGMEVGRPCRPTEVGILTADHLRAERPLRTVVVHIQPGPIDEECQPGPMLPQALHDLPRGRMHGGISALLGTQT